MSDIHHYVKVEFLRFKAFRNFTLHMKHLNILVGPNNAGKSTVLAAFRILDAAMRRAGTRKPENVRGPQGDVLGYSVDLSSISIAEENIFFNYDDSESAEIRFFLSNKHELSLYFPEQGRCYLIVDAQGKSINSPSVFRKHFNCTIGFVPILGPVEHMEPLYGKEAARLALSSYRAARNFRNIWYHYSEKFEEFRAALSQTWPGMDIQAPQVEMVKGKPTLYMFCPEERIPREIFWAGFGFQVWCQMLTHIIQSKNVSLFLVDEPDIYLHSDLQRQLMNILRNLGPDILIATHSTEIITEADAEEIVLVNKKKTSSRRIKDPSQLEEVFSVLGSNINPILTQLAKTRRVLFVEGKDFQIISKFAGKLNYENVASRRDFAVVTVEGFNPEKMKNLKAGMEKTLGVNVLAAAILDKDFRSHKEIEAISGRCANFCRFVKIHSRKEIENYLLVPNAIDRAIAKRLDDQKRRSGDSCLYTGNARKILLSYAEQKKNYISSRYLADRRSFERSASSSDHDATINMLVLNEIEEIWRSEEGILSVIPGKEALSYLNNELQEKYKVSITPSSIIDVMKIGEISNEMKDLIHHISLFLATRE